MADEASRCTSYAELVTVGPVVIRNFGTKVSITSVELTTTTEGGD